MLLLNRISLLSGWFAPRPTEPHYPGATFAPPDCVQLRAPADPAWSALPHPHGPSRESVPVTTTAGIEKVFHNIEENK